MRVLLFAQLRYIYFLVCAILSSASNQCLYPVTYLRIPCIAIGPEFLRPHEI